MKLLNKFVCIILILSINGCLSVEKDSIRITASESDATIIYQDNEAIGSLEISTENISEAEIRIIHEDYKPITKKIIPNKKPRVQISDRANLGILGSIFVGLSGLALAMVGGISNDTSDFLTEEEQQRNNYMLYSGWGLVGLSLGISMYNNEDVLDWKEKYFINMIYNSLYDKEGFHKETGYSKGGYNRNGEYLNGDIFTGSFTNGKKNSYGVFYSFKDKTKYIGTYNNDILEGPGLLISEDEISYGNYRNGYLDGYLVRLSNEGDYIENWEGGNLLKSESYNSKIASKYDFIVMSNYDGLISGTYDAISKDGKIQIKEGEFINGELVNGTMIYSSGLIISGLFSEDELTSGVIYYPDGKIYTGDLTDGKLTGYGTLSFADNSKFEGFLVDGSYEGIGQYIDSLGNLYYGNFENGIFSGTGKLEFYDGGYYEGNFNNGTYNGIGKMVMGNGETFEGSFKNGLPHGDGIYKYKDKIQRAEYYEGARIDQAYQLEKNLKTYKLEQEAKKKIEEQKRLEAQRLAEERQKQLEAERKKQQQKDNVNKLLAGVAGFAIGQTWGMDTANSIQLGAEMIKVVEGDTSTLEAMMRDDLKALQMTTAGSFSGDQSVFTAKKIEAQESKTNEIKNNRIADTPKKTDSSKEKPKSNTTEYKKNLDVNVESFIVTWQNDAGKWRGVGPTQSSTTAWETEEKIFEIVGGNRFKNKVGQPDNFAGRYRIYRILIEKELILVNVKEWMAEYKKVYFH